MINNEINSLNNILNEEFLNIKLIKEKIDSLNEISEDKKEEYLNSLLNPESCVNAKIPSAQPLPTCSFQIKYSVFLDVSNAGSIIIRLNPFFLVDSSVNKNMQVTYDSHEYMYSILNVSSFCYLQNGANTQETDGNWENYYIGQSVPAGLYDMYRLVSASLKVDYVGPLFEAKGDLGGSIIVSEKEYLNVGGLIIGPDMVEYLSSYTCYPEFSTIASVKNGLYSKTTSIRKGLRMLYFPLDRSYLQFCKILKGENIQQKLPASAFDSPEIVSNIGNYDKKGFNWFVYIQGATVGRYYKLEMCCNYECLVRPEVLNYIPTEISNYNIKEEEEYEIKNIVLKNSIK